MDDQEEKMPSAEAFMGRRRDTSREISHGRRLELQRMASQIAADVLEKTKTHERCLLRRMVENLLPGEE